MIPGPLSVTVIRKRLAWLGGGGGPPLATASTLTTTSGRMPASSQASSALWTASFTQVSSALRGLSNPSRCRFLVKNSDTEISRWRAPISTAETAGLGSGAGGLLLATSGFRPRAGAGGLDGFRIPLSYRVPGPGLKVFLEHHEGRELLWRKRRQQYSQLRGTFT